MKKTEKNIRESVLQDFCVQYFRSQGFLTQKEVPFLFKSADLFCFHEQTGECIAVEVKVRNWRRALVQALVYQMMADQVYIALYTKHIGAVDRGLLAAKEVGLLAVDYSGKVDVIIEAPYSLRHSSYFMSSIVATAFPETASFACLML